MKSLSIISFLIFVQCNFAWAQLLNRNSSPPVIVLPNEQSTIPPRTVPAIQAPTQTRDQFTATKETQIDINSWRTDPAFRPYLNFAEKDACPTRTEGWEDLLQNMKNMVTKFPPQCVEANKASFDEISRNAGLLSSAFGQYVNNPGFRPPLSVGNFVGNMMTQVRNIISDCQKTPEKSSLSSFAELIVNASQVGLFIPSVWGPVVTAAGTGLGLIMQTIDTVLQQEHRFEKIEERKAFLDLNCSYFWIRKSMRPQIDKRIFSRSDEYALEKAKLTKEEIMKRLKEVKSKKSSTSSKASSIKNDFVKNELGLNNEYVLNSQLSGIKDKDSNEFWLDLAVSSIDMKTPLRQIIDSLGEDADDRKLKIMAKLLLSELEKLNEEEITKFFNSLDGGEAEKKKMLALVEKVQELLVERFTSKQKSFVGENPANAADSMVATTHKSCTQQEKELNENLRDLTEVMTILKAVKDNNNRFSTQRSGSSDKYDYNTLQEKIEKQLYGENGRRFVRHLTNDSAMALNQFYGQVQNLQKVMDSNFIKYTQGRRDLEALTRFAEVPDRIKICQGAESALSKFNRAKNSTSLAYEYLVSNVDIFHPTEVEQKDWKQTILTFYKSDAKKELRIQRDSVVEAKHHLKNKTIMNFRRNYVYADNYDLQGNPIEGHKGLVIRDAGGKILHQGAKKSSGGLLGGVFGGAKENPRAGFLQEEDMYGRLGRNYAGPLMLEVERKAASQVEVMQLVHDKFDCNKLFKTVGH